MPSRNFSICEARVRAGGPAAALRLPAGAELRQLSWLYCILYQAGASRMQPSGSLVFALAPSAASTPCLNPHLHPQRPQGAWELWSGTEQEGLGFGAQGSGLVPTPEGAPRMQAAEEDQVQLQEDAVPEVVLRVLQGRADVRGLQLPGLLQHARQPVRPAESFLAFLGSLLLFTCRQTGLDPVPLAPARKLTCSVRQ